MFKYSHSPNDVTINLHPQKIQCQCRVELSIYIDVKIREHKIRRSIVEMVSGWPGITVSERRITMKEVMAALAEDRLVEMFGSGTAAVVSPVGGLHYEGRMVSIPTPEAGLAAQIMAAMSDIYYGRVASPWAVDVEEWNVDPKQGAAAAL